MLEVRGSFDDALARLPGARPSAARYVLVNSLNPHRIEGQKTAAFEIVEELGRAPDVLALPYGGGGNTRRLRQGLRRGRARDARSSPSQAAERATTLASAIRIAEPVHADEVDALIASGRVEIVTVADDEIIAAWLELATVEGLFCEPSSAAGLAGARAASSSSRAARSSSCSPATG